MGGVAWCSSSGSDGGSGSQGELTAVMRIWMNTHQV